MIDFNDKDFKNMYTGFDVKYKVTFYTPGCKSMSKFEPDEPEEIYIDAYAVFSKRGKVIDYFDLPPSWVKLLGIEAEALEAIHRKRQSDEVERRLNALNDAVENIIMPTNRMLAKKEGWPW